MSSPWQEWKKRNLERQAQGKVSPIDFVNPNTEYVSESVSARRFSICEKCPNLMITKQCSKCMCFMPVKVKLFYASCPEGLW